MTWSRYLIGVVLLVSVTVPPAVGAHVLCNRLVPSWPRWPRLLADVIVAVTAVVVLAEVLGTVGLLRPIPLGVGGQVLGLVLFALGDRRTRSRPATPPERPRRADLALAVVAVTGLVAQAFGSIVETFNRGVYDIDSLHYHLTYAAEFARSGSTTAIPYISPTATPYHPANAELLHSVGLVAFKVELLSLVLHLGSLTIALLAAAALGSRVGRSAAAVAIVAAILSLPMLGPYQAGTLANDVLAIAFALACIAFTVWRVELAQRSRAPDLLAGLAAGLAVGTKLTVVAVVGLVLLASLVVSPSVRDAGRRLLVLVPAALLSGGYWALRNLVAVGNPIPGLDLGIGPLRLPQPRMPIIDLVDQSVLHYAGDADVREQWLDSGLEFALGPWRYVVLVLLVVAAIVLVADGATRLRRLLGLAGIGGIVAYLATPTTAGGLEGVPTLFQVNIRYAVPALSLLVVGALLSRVGARFGTWWAGAWVAIQLVTLSTPDSWAPHAHRHAAWITAGTVLLAGVGLVAAAARWRHATWPVIGAVAVAALVFGGVHAQTYVNENRYARPHFPRAELSALGRFVGEGDRTGVGGMSLLASFYGSELQADVEYIADVVDDHEVRIPRTCTAWRKKLAAERYDHVVIIRRYTSDLTGEQWTASIPGVRVEFANGAGAAFTLPDEVTTAGCS